MQNYAYFPRRLKLFFRFRFIIIIILLTFINIIIEYYVNIKPKIEAGWRRLSWIDVGSQAFFQSANFAVVAISVMYPFFLAKED